MMKVVFANKLNVFVTNTSDAEMKAFIEFQTFFNRDGQYFCFEPGFGRGDQATEVQAAGQSGQIHPVLIDDAAVNTELVIKDFFPFQIVQEEASFPLPGTMKTNRDNIIP